MFVPESAPPHSRRQWHLVARDGMMAHVITIGRKWRHEMQQRQTSSVCIAGATGWAGRGLVQGVLEAADLALGAAVSRSASGQDLGEALGREALGVPVYGRVGDALDGVDVLIDYTSPTAVKPNTLTAIESGVAVVIGTSGLTASDYAEIDRAARDRSVGVVASGNFSLTAAMCQAAALLAARHLPHWEVIDYASATKPDVPSGTARELAERLGAVRPPALGHPIEDLHGPQEARGATIAGTQVHSIRVPSFVVSTEVVFGLPDERLTIRHDAGGTPEPYVAGTLIAARRAPELVGLTRGLDTLLIGGD
jgi:4-hydroxy-tetrahydrodipicolinate reductase